MNPEDQVTYIVLKTLIHKAENDSAAYQAAIRKANQVDPGNHLVADTLRLIDANHNQFLNCPIKLQGANYTKPIPDLDSGSSKPWVTHVGKLELKRLEFDYK